MLERIATRKRIIKAKVLSRTVGTMKTNACSLRARNECVLLIEAYKMPDEEYLAFDATAFVEEVVSESMKLTEKEEATLRPKSAVYLAQLAAHSRSVKKDVRWTATCEGTLAEKVKSRARLDDDDVEYRHALKKARQDLSERTWEGPGRDQEGYMSSCAWAVQLSDGSWREVPEWFEEAKPLFGKLGHLLVIAFLMTLAAAAPVWIALLMGLCVYGGKYQWEVRFPAHNDEQRLDWLLAAHYRGLKEVSLLGGD
jgi:hypothetical protein